MLSLINAYRTTNGVPALSQSPSLSRSAIWKSGDMAANHYFAHDDLIRSWGQRLSDCGYPSAFDGENIAEGFADASSTLMQWETSPPHNANLLNASYHAIGVGRAQSGGGDWYWTADFGGLADSDQPAAGANVAAAPSSAITTGLTVFVNTPGDCLRARVTASMSASSPTCVKDGTALFIVDGPVTADGHTWWDAFGYGWVAGDYLRAGH